MKTGCGINEGTGYVYYLNFSPEADEVWQEIASEYTAQTGVPVKVVTAASGSYSDTLTAQMCKNDCPTLFAIRTTQELNDWDKYCYDLTGTKFADMLETTDNCLYDDEGRMCAVGYCTQSYGIITNLSLLKKSGHSTDEIHDFASLKTVVEDIHRRRGELGFDAFTSSGLDPSSSWRFSGHLASIPLYYEFRDKSFTTQPDRIDGTYLDFYKNIWDLYINNSSTSPGELSSATGDLAEEEFGSGKAVFYQNGSWEYPALTSEDKYAMDPEDLAMIPIYIGIDGENNAGLCTGTEDCWAVNSHTDQANIDATLDFLYWMVSSDRGRKMMADQFGVTPFKGHIESDNLFISDAEQMEKQGKYNVNWAFKYTPNTETWRLGVVSALEGYSSGKADWDEVVSAFVNGWNYQYKLEHCILD